MTGYTFDLTTNELSASYRDNSEAGRSHSFIAYRPAQAPGPRVSLRGEIL